MTRGCLLFILPIISEIRANFPARKLHVICTGTRTYRDRKHNFSNNIVTKWYIEKKRNQLVVLLAGLKNYSCIYSEYIEKWKGSKTRKCYMHTPGARVLKYSPPIRSIPLWPSQPRTLTSQNNSGTSVYLCFWETLTRKLELQQ